MPRRGVPSADPDARRRRKLNGRLTRWLCRSACLLGLALPSGANADTGRDIAATCAACHGTDGRSRSAIPSLAGRDKSELSRAMREFREGRRSSTIMQQIAKGYTEAEIEAAATYFAAQKAP
jgi:cytochrome c553